MALGLKLQQDQRRRRVMSSGLFKCQHVFRALVACSVVILFFNMYVFQYGPLPSGPECEGGRRLSAAIVLFGVPKEFDAVWDAYLAQIVERNPHVDFEGHLHVYSDVTTLTNAKNRELDAPVAPLNELRRVLQKAPGLQTFVVTSSQSQYDASELAWVTKDDTNFFDPCCWTGETLKNMFRQGNSIFKAFESASSREPDLYVFARSDTLLTSPIDIPCAGLSSREVHLPSWQVHRDEYVDRFAIAGPEAAAVYAQAKAEAYRDMILDWRGKKTWWLQMLGGTQILGRDLRNSERMLKLWLDKNQLEVRLMPKEWARLLRIRSGGRLNARDARTFGIRRVGTLAVGKM